MHSKLIINLPERQPMLPSYKNRLNDLHCESIEWFLHDENTGSHLDDYC